MRLALLVIGIFAAGVGRVMLDERFGWPDKPAHEVEYLPMPAFTTIRRLAVLRTAPT